jgi:hypothetical protein
MSGVHFGKLKGVLEEMENGDDREMILRLAALLEQQVAALREIGRQWDVLSRNDGAWLPYLGIMKELAKYQGEACDKLLKRSVKIVH